MSIRLAATAAASLLGLGAAALSVPSTAHHSFASEFDAQRPVVVEGKVSKVRIVNPHAWIFIDVPGADGKVTNWGFEFGSPITLSSKGLGRANFPVGTAIKIDGFRAKNNGPFGYAQEVVLPDGRAVKIGSAPDAPTRAGAR